ncbi:MAG: hypothetical protein RLZ81_1067 [Pseudomonadota bacterium]|jgi:outer membrane protein|nr:MAG: hypothetical protein E6Q94_08395 [Burkholderiaceae bacterium]
MPPLQLWAHRVRGLWPCVGWLTLMAGSGSAALAQPADPTALKWAFTLSAPLPAPGTQADTAPDANLPRATPWSALLDAAQQQAAANRVADANVGAAQALEQQARAMAWMPRVELSGSRSTQKQTYNGMDSRTPASALTLSTTLPLWRAAERASVNAQEALTEQSRWQARAQRTTVARELSQAYVAAAEAAEQGRLAEAQLALLESQLHINERRLQAGVGTVLDRLETLTRIDEVRANIREWRMRAATQRLTVARLSGDADARTAAGLSAQPIPLPDQLPPLPEALSLAVQVNPQWQDAQAGIAAARATSAARDAEAWQPTLDAVASASRTRQTQRFEGLTERQNVSTQAVGVQFNWPLFSGGYHQGRVQESVALLTRAQAQSDHIEAEIQTRLRDAYQRLNQAQAVITAQQAVARTATATHEAVHKAFVAGLRTNLDLLNAQQQIYTARQNLVAARITALSAHLDILALLDRLDPTHAAQLTPQLDPQAMTEPTP